MRSCSGSRISRSSAGDYDDTIQATRLKQETAISDTALSARKRNLIAVIASMVIVNLVYGLTLPLLSLVLDAQGISKRSAA